MKTRAYLDQTGKNTVTAWSVAKERDRLYRGDSTGLTYYSTDPAGHRKPMAHVYRKGCAPHFKYINAADEHSGGSGESLQHLLFKEAVASIGRTTLKLGKFGDYRITITAAEVERGIDHPESLRRSDVFLKFESDTSLALKWGGVLYVEIRRSHAVDKDKLDIVRSLRLPMVEVPIPDNILYEFDEETTTDEREAAYVSRIKKMLEGPNGFLAGEVLNNPSTLEYLEKQLPMVRQQLTKSESARAVAEARVKELSDSVDLLEKNAIILKRRAVEAEENATVSASSVRETQSEVSRLRKDLADREKELKELQGQQNEWHIDGRWALAAFFGLVFMIATIQYFRH
jgi:hypothetical protein